MIGKLGALCAAFAMLTACAPAQVEQAPDPWVAPVELAFIGPGTLLPGTVIGISGSGFLDPEFGANRIHWKGKSTKGDVDILSDARYLSENTLELDVTEELFEQLGGDGASFDGAVRMEVTNLASNAERVSEILAYDAELARSLRPELRSLQTNTSVYVNDPVAIGGAGFLLGGAEGTTYVRIGGCFYPGSSATCVPVETATLPVTPAAPGSRDAGTFAFSHRLTGLRAGLFRGTISLRNENGASGDVFETEDRQIELTLEASEVLGISTEAASLGQYVDINGAGFVGGDDEAITLLEVSGDFVSGATGNARTIDLLLVPDFRSGRSLRYLLNEEDGLGQEINLRRESGMVTGTARVVTRYRGDEQRGSPVPFSFGVAPIKQVVAVFFLPSYVESLGRFGLRAVDSQIRSRVLDTARIPYVGVNVEFRTELPTDFALYSVVEISGKDPNNEGLFGYDNTPGKDTNNLRLTDRIGGVNARTQGDGFPGYGGVFIDSFFQFGGSSDISDPLFDQMFDPFRTSRGGRPVSAADLEAGFPELPDGTVCLDAKLSRPTRIACAIWALGNLIGSTLSHEVGHSVGLANPYDPAEFHNIGDQTLRLMDAGGARPFAERIDVEGQGTAHFCDEEYAYLREIMPLGDEDDRPRALCF